MTRADLDQLAGTYGLKVDGTHQGAGKFADLHIGIGAPYSTLADFRKDLIKRMGIGHQVHFDHVDNQGHEDFGKPFVHVHSFWNA